MPKPKRKKRWSVFYDEDLFETGEQIPILDDSGSVVDTYRAALCELVMGPANERGSGFADDALARLPDGTWIWQPKRTDDALTPAIRLTIDKVLSLLLSNGCGIPRGYESDFFGEPVWFSRTLNEDGLDDDPAARDEWERIKGGERTPIVDASGDIVGFYTWPHCVCIISTTEGRYFSNDSLARLENGMWIWQPKCVGNEIIPATRLSNEEALSLLLKKGVGVPIEFEKDFLSMTTGSGHGDVDRLVITSAPFSGSEKQLDCDQRDTLLWLDSSNAFDYESRKSASTIFAAVKPSVERDQFKRKLTLLRKAGFLELPSNPQGRASGYWMSARGRNLAKRFKDAKPKR